MYVRMYVIHAFRDLELSARVTIIYAAHAGTCCNAYLLLIHNLNLFSIRNVVIII